MTTTSPGPLRTGDGTGPELAAALRRAGIEDVDDSGLARALYSSDASLYRVHPRAVVRPRDVDEVLATLAVCRELGRPADRPRRRHVHRGQRRRAGRGAGHQPPPEPGPVASTPRHGRRWWSRALVQAALQTAARPHGLRFGPDPSTHNRCTIGGMIGNNACGSRALGYGRTSDNVVGLDVVTGGGTRLELGPGTTPDAGPLADLHRLVAGSLGTIRTEFGRFGRQVSGYSLEHLLPERGFDVARALVGSEGTLGAGAGRDGPAGHRRPRAWTRGARLPRRWPTPPTPPPGCSPTSPRRSRASTSGSCSDCATCPPPSSRTCRAAPAG